MRRDAWDPKQYERFHGERSQAFFDLLGLLEPVPGGRVVDLGCGTGRLTAAVPELLGAAEVLGVDNSPAMLADARALATDGVCFIEGDLGTWTDRPRWDVVLANASLHWAPDHAGVLARWRDALVPGGQLAVQVPANADQPTHIVATELAEEEPFASAFVGGPPPDVVAANVLAPEAYARILDELGFVEQHVRLQVYPHHLATTADIVEWVKGTTLTRFEAQLSPELYAEFVERYRALLLERLGDRSPCFFPFKRILFRGRLA